MGIFDVFKGLLGSAPTSRQSLWKNLSDEELQRVWRSRSVLPAATILGIRDEHIRRLLPLPPSDVPSVFCPPVAGLTDETDADQTIDILSEYDPRSWSSLDGVRLGRLGVLVTGEAQQCVLIVFRGWRNESPTDGDLPTLEDGETLAAVVAVDADTDLGRFHQQGIPCHGDADHPITDPVTHGGITVLPHATFPKVLHVQNQDGLTLLCGPSVPLAVIEEEPDYIIGGLSMPRDTETLEAIAESWNPQVAATSVEQVIVLPEVAGVDGLHAGEFARGLGLAPRMMVNGQLITANAQPVVSAALRGAWDEVASLAAERDSTTLDEAFRVLVVNERLDDAQRLLDAVPREGARGDYLTGLVRQLGGDATSARTAYEATTSGDESVSGAHCQLSKMLAADGDWTGALEQARAGADARMGDPIAAANHAIAAWRAGAADEAQEVMQETQVATRSWLGAMLDAMLDGEPADADCALLSVAGTHLGPYASALEALRSGLPEEGERLLRRCLQLAPEQPGAQGELALHLAAEGRLEEAIALSEETLAALPYHVFLRAIYGWLLMHASRFDEAVEAYEQAITHSGDHGDWWINLVLGQIARGDRAGAERTIGQLEGHVRDMDLIATLRRTARDAGESGV